MKVEIEISCDDIVVISNLSYSQELSFQEVVGNIFQSGLRIQSKKPEIEIKLVPLCDIRVATLQQNIVLEHLKKLPFGKGTFVGVLDFKTLLVLQPTVGLLEYSYDQKTNEVVYCE